MKDIDDQDTIKRLIHESQKKYFAKIQATFPWIYDKRRSILKNSAKTIEQLRQSKEYADLLGLPPLVATNSIEKRRVETFHATRHSIIDHWYQHCSYLAELVGKLRGRTIYLPSPFVDFTNSRSGILGAALLFADNILIEDSVLEWLFYRRNLWGGKYIFNVVQFLLLEEFSNKMNLPVFIVPSYHSLRSSRETGLSYEKKHQAIDIFSEKIQREFLTAFSNQDYIGRFAPFDTTYLAEDDQSRLRSTFQLINNQNGVIWNATPMIMHNSSPSTQNFKLVDHLDAIVQGTAFLADLNIEDILDARDDKQFTEFRNNIETKVTEYMEKGDRNELVYQIQKELRLITKEWSMELESLRRKFFSKIITDGAFLVGSGIAGYLGWQTADSLEFLKYFAPLVGASTLKDVASTIIDYYQERRSLGRICAMVHSRHK